MWFLYSVIAAFATAVVGVLAKLDTQQIDPLFATMIRAVVMLLIFVVVSFSFSKTTWHNALSFSSRTWVILLTSGVAAACGWLFYFFALATGPTSPVTALSQLAVIFVVFLSALVLGEALTIMKVVGALIMVAGAFLITQY